MSNTVSNQGQVSGTNEVSRPGTPQQTRGSGKWVTVVILGLIVAFFFSSVILNRIAMTQG